MATAVGPAVVTAGDRVGTTRHPVGDANPAGTVISEKRDALPHVYDYHVKQ